MTSVTKNLHPPTKKYFFKCNLLGCPIRLSPVFLKLVSKGLQSSMGVGLPVLFFFIKETAFTAFAFNYQVLFIYLTFLCTAVGFQQWPLRFSLPVFF